MGTISHDAVIVVLGDYETETIEAIEAFRQSLDPFWSKLILGPVVGINGYTTFFFAPDGSKEGWGPSNEGNEHRATFADLARGHGHVELARFGELGHWLRRA